MGAAAPELDASPGQYRRTAVVAAAWVVVVGVALVLDPWVADHARRFNASFFTLRNSVVGEVLKFPGDFRFTLAAAVAALVLHPWKWRAGGLLCLSAIVGGAVYTVIKWGVGRKRPVVEMPYEVFPFAGGLRGLFVAEKNLTFPSGHVTCAFATAAALAMLYPRWRWAFYGLASVVAVERVAERAHYLSDVVAAAGIGLLCVRVALMIAGLIVRPAPSPLESRGGSGQAEPSGRGVSREAPAESTGRR